MDILVTGVAGFIGSNVALRLLNAGVNVCGIDNMNSYYDVRLKEYRLGLLKGQRRFHFKHIDLSDRESTEKLFENGKFDIVVHLAAQAGVRHSLSAPFDYVDSNLVGMMTILEGCRHSQIQHLVYASSSSVYGANTKIPFSESDRVDSPVSLYAATKRCNELMANSYSCLYGIPCTGLRFFTVYGPAGRPDMAPWLFTSAILKGKPINVYNGGEMIRDFTYIDDIVEGVVRICEKPPASTVPHEIYNIGNNSPVKLMRFIEAIERSCGLVAKKNFVGMQQGDVPVTYADIDALESAVGYRPQVEIEEGIDRFVCWFRDTWL
ncbi:nucleoside-diphosphate-sugar epimerase [gamma proteobacterium HIMB55]|nr:nucleoside-diphosphate-sugar epimerase [gamma proteobacterium HIMB55]